GGTAPSLKIAKVDHTAEARSQGHIIRCRSAARTDIHLAVRPIYVVRRIENGNVEPLPCSCYRCLIVIGGRIMPHHRKVGATTMMLITCALLHSSAAQDFRGLDGTWEGSLTAVQGP